MAVPKRKISKQRKHKRRTHWKLETPELVRCPQCNTLRIPHKVCGECKYYNGRQVVEPETK